MAKETVAVPVEEFRAMQEQIAGLLQADRIRREAETNPNARIIDRDYEAWKAEVGRPASERTQDAADRLFGVDGRRFLVRLDSTTEEGKPGPRVAEHFPLTITANSDLEAKARYESLMGIRKHDYTIKVEPVAA